MLNNEDDKINQNPSKVSNKAFAVLSHKDIKASDLAKKSKDSLNANDNCKSDFK